MVREQISGEAVNGSTLNKIVGDVLKDELIGFRAGDLILTPRLGVYKVGSHKDENHEYGKGGYRVNEARLMRLGLCGFRVVLESKDYCSWITTADDFADYPGKEYKYTKAQLDDKFARAVFGRIKVKPHAIETHLRGVELLRNKIVIKYHLDKPWGVPDVEDSVEITYKGLDNLPTVERKDNPGIERVSIPNQNKTLVLEFSSCQERNGGPLEEDFKGVFLEKK